MPPPESLDGSGISLTTWRFGHLHVEVSYNGGAPKADKSWMVYFTENSYV